jgi:hypothetical protein|tara:strand:- start:29 stop:253 length:225 start_codon:yes stop_codon:yes gene_type:complete
VFGDIEEQITQAALDRLTEDRKTVGATPPEVEELLSSLGVFWDEEENCYFCMTAYVAELNHNILGDLVPRENYA